jgi:hypothetical protein
LFGLVSYCGDWPKWCLPKEGKLPAQFTSLVLDCGGGLGRRRGTLLQAPGVASRHVRPRLCASTSGRILHLGLRILDPPSARVSLIFFVIAPATVPAARRGRHPRVQGGPGIRTKSRNSLTSDASALPITPDAEQEHPLHTPPSAVVSGVGCLAMTVPRAVNLIPSTG